MRFVGVDEQGARQATVEQALWGDEVVMIACGLMPGREVTLRAKVANYTAQATFLVNSEGCIDTGLAAPVAGDWTGIDPDGPFWSARPKGKTPTDNAAYLPVQVTVAEGDEVQAEATLQRFFVDPAVTVTPVDANGLVGVLAVPPGPGPHPVVVAFGGSEGGLRSGAVDANQLASKGFATLGLAYFGEPGLPAQLAQIELEYFAKAFSFLATQPSLDLGRLAVKGVSRGGELALQLGSTFSAVRAVVADVPSGYRWGSGVGSQAAWTYQGQALASVPSSGGMYPTKKDASGKTLLLSSPVFLQDIQEASAQELEAATIAVESTQGPVLLLGGASDDLWPSCTLADVAWNRLVSSGHTKQHPDENHCLADAGHFATGLPGFSTLLSDRTEIPGYLYEFSLGGTPAGNAHAQREARRLTLQFLRKALAL